MLEQLGCEVVQINGEPTGEFAHPPEPIEKNLQSLASRTAAEDAVIGFAQDPDAVPESIALRGLPAKRDTFRFDLWPTGIVACFAKIGTFFN